MSIEADIYLGDEDSQEGSVEVESPDDEVVMIHFRVKGDVVASAVLDRFTAGVLVGHITAGALEAVKA